MNLFNQAKNYIIVGLAVALAALGIYHWGQVQYFEGVIAKLEKNVTELKSALTVAVDANTKLTEAIGIQNSSIDNMKRDASARQQAAANALAKAKADAGRWKKKYDDILTMPPENPEDQAGSLNLRLNQYLAARQMEIGK